MHQQLPYRIRQLEPWQRTLYIMFIVRFTTAVGFSSVFPFLPLYVQSLDSRSGLSVEFLVGLTFSAQATTMMIVSPLWGVLADRYGRKVMVQRATFGGAVLIGLMGFVGLAEQLIVLRAIQGGITGVVAAVNALVAGLVPRQRMGYAMGVLQVGMAGGIAFGPLLGGFLADAFGYQMAFLSTGLLLLLAGVLVSVGVEEKSPWPTPTARKRSAGLLADWRAILAAPGVGLTYTLNFLTGLCRMMFVPILPLFILSLLPESARVNTFTGLVIGISAATGTMTAIYLGRLGDRRGRRQILAGCSLAAGFLFIPQILVTTGWQLLLLQALTGAAAGGIMPTLAALLAHYTQPGEEGRVYGMENSIRAASRAVAPMAGSAIAAWFGLRMTFAATGLLFWLVAGLALYLLPKTQGVVRRPEQAR